MSERQSLLDATLAAATKDPQMARSDGTVLRHLTAGVTIRPLPTIRDERGSITELFDPRWDTYPGPLVFSYTFMIRPGIVKGWNLHREHQDRYVVLTGDMLLVLFDPRPGSPTEGEICRVVLSGSDRCVVNVPENVWHADHNIGTSDVVVVNFPTLAYDHSNPDKYRLPLDSPLIPYSFSGAKGW